MGYTTFRPAGLRELSRQALLSVVCFFFLYSLGSSRKREVMGRSNQPAHANIIQTLRNFEKWDWKHFFLSMCVRWKQWVIAPRVKVTHWQMWASSFCFSVSVFENSSPRYSSCISRNWHQCTASSCPLSSLSSFSPSGCITIPLF